MQTSIRSKPPKYLCERRTNCYRWPEDVKVTEKETTAIAPFLKMKQTDIEVNQFGFVRSRPNKSSITQT
jgi:hypothetical protein